MPEIKHTPCRQESKLRRKLKADVYCYAVNVPTLKQEGKVKGRRREGKRADEHFAEKNLIFKCAKLLMRKPNINNSTGK